MGSIAGPLCSIIWSPERRSPRAASRQLGGSRSSRSATGSKWRTERFEIVSVMDLQPAPGTAAFASEVEASEWLRQESADDPDRFRKFQVVPAFEREAA